MKEVPSDIVKFEEEWIGLEAEKAKGSTGKQYKFRLGKIKEVTECKDFNKFFDSDIYWKRLNNWCVSKGKSVKYRYNLVAAIIKYYKIMFPEDKYPTKRMPSWIRLPSIKGAGKERKEMKSKLVLFLKEDFPRIYDADLSKYSPKPEKAERDRMMMIFGAFSGDRRSEIRNILMEDIDWKGHQILVREIKTGKDPYWRPVIEDKFWKCLERYIEVRNAADVKSKYLFPSFSNKNEKRECPQFNQPETITHIVGKLGQLVWGKKIFPHIFRHLRVTSLSEYLDIYELTEMMSFTLGTASVYVGQKRRAAKIMEALGKKPRSDLI